MAKEEFYRVYFTRAWTNGNYAPRVSLLTSHIHIMKELTMKSLLVYFSKFGNTQKVSEAIAEELAKAGPVELISSSELTVDHLEVARLVVMGTPTHNMNLPKTVRPILARLPKRCLKGKLVAAFDTSYEMNWMLNQFTASKRLDKALRRLGGKRAARPQIFLVMGREGPLFDGELDRAREWAATILARLPETAARRPDKDAKAIIGRPTAGAQ
jgi:flavodoxin